MLTGIYNTQRHLAGQAVTNRQLMLNGYSAIQYCTGHQPAGSWYTEDIHLLFIKSGTLRLRYGKADFTIEKNQIALLKKNIRVEYPEKAALSTETVEYIQFTLKHEIIKEFTKMSALPVNNREQQVPVIVKDSAHGWITYVGSLEPYLHDTCNPEAGLIKIKMLELLFHLGGLDKRMLEQLLDIQDQLRTDITSTVEDNINNSMSVEQLAILSGRSLSSFRRDFMAIYNMPPSQWIRLKRLEKAKELLLGTTMTVTDICYTLGFENIAHFSRLFKSHFGHPPSDYKINFLAA